jgi:hypothetical protein
MPVFLDKVFDLWLNSKRQSDLILRVRPVSGYKNTVVRDLDMDSFFDLLRVFFALD